MGAWIETQCQKLAPEVGRRRTPTRVRGLKCLSINVELSSALVVPHTGAWIEMIHHLAEQEKTKLLNHLVSDSLVREPPSHIKP